MNLSIKTLLLSISFILSLTANAQLSSYDYNDETKFKFSIRYASINTSGVPEDSVKDISGILIRALELDKIAPGIGAYNVSHRWAFLPESLVLIFIDAINGGDFTAGSKNTSTGIGDFIIGWHNSTFNLVYNDNFSFGAGVHWGDYFLGFEPYDPANNNFGLAREPAGWYGVLGPAVMMDYNIINKAVLHIEGGYGLSLKFMDFPEMVVDKNYRNPHFLNFTVQFRSNSFVYGGMEFVRSLNRGGNNFNASRTDFFVGVWF